MIILFFIDTNNASCSYEIRAQEDKLDDGSLLLL